MMVHVVFDVTFSILGDIMVGLLGLETGLTSCATKAQSKEEDQVKF